MRKTTALGFLLFIPLMVCPLKAGSYAFDFVDLGIGTRARALGGSFTSIADDGSSLLWNPAGSSHAPSATFYFSHNVNFSGMATIDYIAFIKPIVGSSSFSIAVLRHAVDDIPIFPELEGTPQQRDTMPELQGDGNPLGYFGETATIYFVNIAKQLNFRGMPLSIGANFKYFNESLFSAEATGIGLDIGTILILKTKIPGTIGIGINMQDLSGTRIVWNTKSEAKDEIPMNYRMGVHYHIPVASIKSSFRASLDRNTRYGGTTHAGIEYSFNDIFFGDMGWNESRWSFGTGCRFWKIGIQYGFITHTLGSSHALSMEFIL